MGFEKLFEVYEKVKVCKFDCIISPSLPLLMHGLFFNHWCYICIYTDVSCRARLPMIICSLHLNQF